MPLGRALQKLIADSDLNQADTIRKCEELGIKIEKSTLNKILYGKIKKPNLETLKAIAKICKGDINNLLIEMYFDNSPKKIQEILYNLQLKTSNVTKSFIENEFDEKTEKEIKRKISDEPIADFLISLSNLDENDMDINKLFVKEDNEVLNNILDNKFKTLNISIGVPIADNGMSPIIQKDSTVTIQIKNKTDYQINDIILVYLIKDKKFIARYVRFEKDKIFLYGINKNYQIEEYKEHELAIVGKIIKVTNNI